MRKAIIILVDINALSGRKHDEEEKRALGELNDHLKDGWSIEHSFPMSGTGNNILSSSVVVLHKD